MNLWETFTEAVAVHFRFLKTEAGFACTLTKIPNVIFESEKLQVQVYYDANGRHELDLGIRRLVDDPHKTLSIGIGMLMRLHGDKSGYMSPFPATPETVEAEVKRLAEILRKDGSSIFSGDLRDFDRTERLEHELAKKFAPPEYTHRFS